MNMNETLRKKAMSLPQTPGVYLMKNQKGAIIYVGKAKALKSRVSQYFNGQPHDIKVEKMIGHVEDFDYILTGSEFEALVLECSLIKRHMPKYNILLKDDKGYHYIKITNGPWPSITAVKKKFEDGAEYIGPYTSSYTVTRSVDEALKIFRLPQCSKIFPRDRGKSRPCLNHFIGQCAAPCGGKISEEDYNAAVSDAVRFLKGGSGAALKDLTARMKEASDALDFEKAAKYRDAINALKRVTEKQKVVAAGVRELDAFAVVSGGSAENSDSGEKACLAVLRFADYKLFDSEHFFLDNPKNLPEARHELLRGYYMMRGDVPSKIAVDGPVEGRELLEEWLASKAGRKVTIAQPQKGKQAEILAMCRSNAAEKLAQSMGRKGKDTEALDELARLLSLPSPPAYIEAYDISHTAGGENVAGMVVFKNGLPYKQAYKRFQIKGFTGQDDYASMAEVVSRRLNRFREGSAGDEGFARLPDLILLDGGAGQVNAVAPVLAEFGLDIPVFGMVKDSRHRTRAIAAGGGEIALNSKRRAFSLVSAIQEEVHRFAVEYHRLKRKKAVLTGELTGIEGVGEARAKALLKHFQTMKAIKAATAGELAAVRGISETAANRIYRALHEDT